jgi:hypothetical protein
MVKMAEDKNLNQPNQPNQENPNEERAVGAAAGAPNPTDAQDIKAQRGGEQEDQITGQTSEGALNQSRENRNPSGNNPDRNQSGRQEGNEF